MFIVNLFCIYPDSIFREPLVAFKWTLDLVTKVGGNGLAREQEKQATVRIAGDLGAPETRHRSTLDPLPLTDFEIPRALPEISWMALEEGLDLPCLGRFQIGMGGGGF